MDLEIVIEGVADVRMAKAINRKIREVCEGAGRSGLWSVLMSPSETRGQWDLGVRSPTGRAFASFPERDGALPELVAARLRACL
jgi:hypothetical protein